MKKVVISARQFIADLRARIGDAALREKYNLSPASLLNLKKELLSRRLITSADVSPTSEPPRPDRKALNAKQFAEEFRQHPDDFYLMDRYSLTPSQLRTVYRRLLERGVLSEYEFHTRDAAAPEVDEASIIPMSATALLSTPSEEPEISARSSSRGPGDLPEDFYRDFSGIKLGSTSQLPLDPGLDSPQKGKDSPKDQPTVVLLTTELCPNCQRPKDDFTAESCPYCGIVFSKVKRGHGMPNITVWGHEDVD
ncbi:MAG: hypothetical protein HY914_16030 [Desulfomonile tiedjei]|nr:hypothetical protein [Desulfomonile tiedjei]